MRTLAQRRHLSTALRQSFLLLRRPGAIDAALGLFVFAIAFAVYNATLTPGLSYVSPDGNELVSVAYKLDLAHMTGYPLYTWLGKLFTFLPAGDIAHRMNLMSAFGAAGTAALLFGSLRLLNASRVAALFGAFFLAFSTTLWSQAVITEVYAPNAFMLSLVFFTALLWGRTEQAGTSLLQATRRSTVMFWGLCLVYGLSLGVHLSNLALAPALAAYVLLVNRRAVYQPRLILPGAALFALGLLQYLWLPLKADTLLDLPMQRNAPDTLEGFYNYTVNAFPQMKFAFPWEAIPERIVLYLQLARANFGYPGIALGLFGMWEMLWRHPREFYLFIVFYLTEVAFFIQYRVFDIDVFFIPAHMMMALFAGFAVHRLITYVARLGARVRLAGPAYAGVAVLAALPALALLGHNSKANDQSGDTVINDFYEEVFDRLPQSSVLVGKSGVFGYDMFYYQLVYDRRPDVLMPLAQDQPVDVNELRGRPLFTTVRPAGKETGRGPFMPPAPLMPDDLWYEAVLVAPTDDEGFDRLTGSLILYRATATPPGLVVAGVRPENIVNHDFGGITLAGYDIDALDVEAGSTVHVVLYWQMRTPAAYVVVSKLGDSSLRETHPLGFGDLKRYAEEFRPRQGLIKEEYDLLIPSSTDTGTQVLRVGLETWPAVGGEEAEKQMIELVELRVLEPAAEASGG